MYMYLFLWCFLWLKIVKIVKMGFLFSVNAYAFIPMVPFLWLKIAKNYQKWVYMEMGEIFFVWDLKIWLKEQRNTLLACSSNNPQR